MKRFADLKYTRKDLEEDAVHYLKTQVYEPAYVNQVKDFLSDDTADFKQYYDDEHYAFHNAYYDEYVTGYTEEDDDLIPQVDFRRLTSDLEDDFSRLGMDDEEVDRYTMMLEAEFRKNAFCSHMEPYFLGYDSVVATVIAGYSRDPVFSIYSEVREWAMALHFKRLYPQQMRKFGYRYQTIRENYKGDERLKMLLNFRDKYRLTLQNIGLFRAAHSSIFAYTYLYLRAVLSGETDFIEDFILEASSSQIYLLLEGESVKNIDFTMVKWALNELKSGRYKEMITPDEKIDWDAVYDFAYEAIQSAGGMENLRALGFESKSARSIRAFWNKSANMQKMLKILRQMALENSDPIINSLIEMCEYRLGRPNDKSKKRMERFIEQTRKIMAAHAYELTKPRTMSQDLLAAFPSVFLVYFQWHHNFRNIYPKVQPKQVYNEKQKQERQQADSRLINKIRTDEMQRHDRSTLADRQSRASYDEINRQSRQLDNATRRTLQNDTEKARAVAAGRERDLNGIQPQQSRKEQLNTAIIAGRSRDLNSL